MGSNCKGGRVVPLVIVAEGAEVQHDREVQDGQGHSIGQVPSQHFYQGEGLHADVDGERQGDHSRSSEGCRGWKTGYNNDGHDKAGYDNDDRKNEGHNNYGHNNDGPLHVLRQRDRDWDGERVWLLPNLRDFCARNTH